MNPRALFLVPSLASVASLASLALVGAVLAAPAKPAPKPPPGPDAAGPPTALSAVARIAKVRVDVTPGGAAITHDLVFPKGAVVVTGAGDPTLFFAFTAQARPLAIEATRHALDANGELVESGAKVEIIDVFVKPKSAAVALGPANQAGHVLRVPRDAAPFGLRVRSAIVTHEVASPTPTVSVLARLGVRGLGPMPVAAIEIGTMLGGTLRGARATFCGEGADPRPLTVSFVGYPASASDAGAATGGDAAGDAGTGTIPPTAAQRTANDDLCIDLLI